MTLDEQREIIFECFVAIFSFDFEAEGDSLPGWQVGRAQLTARCKWLESAASAGRTQIQQDL